MIKIMKKNENILFVCATHDKLRNYYKVEVYSNKFIIRKKYAVNGLGGEYDEISTVERPDLVNLLKKLCNEKKSPFVKNELIFWRTIWGIERLQNIEMEEYFKKLEIKPKD
jgi:hypothetical protein